MKKKTRKPAREVRQALERLEDVSADGDQQEIEDAVFELAGVLSGPKDKEADGLSDLLRRRKLDKVAELAEELEEALDNAPSNGEAAEEAEEHLRELAQVLFAELDELQESGQLSNP